MSSQAAQIIAALRRGHDELVSRLAALGPDDIVRTSGSADWTVAQTVSHLGSGAVISKASLDAALAGDANPGMDFNKEVWARWDGMTPDEQVAAFPAVNEELVGAFEALDDRALVELRIDLGFMPQPLDVAGVAGMRLTEFALHAWDVNVAFDPTATVARDAAVLLVDTIGPLLRFAGKADQVDGAVTVAVRATMPDRDLGLVIDDVVELTDLPAAAEAKIVAPTEYLVRLFSGRHAAEHTPESVKVTGSLTLDDLRRVFPGY
ncbi:maleylpyruvate isomerase family mycothiol-dependent enzyme [Kutzneria sp. 744]|uniref:maleylpyruvate isomerase family mycothiol-dependent enzyme n=1 Tax=Kutzneria sp. (strain 744) TaxID=345341 RepID=UPI0003EED640|nr:maleylpyruvate isomerase family mycothiol-dependent enzyme [Kutzneria sp. 744]EWM11111.1 LigA protein [Kutzneria sp. 744]